jgi:predicted AAA+ superfamily ATPase
VEYFDCELPRTRRLLDDPEGFLDSVKGKRVVLDEVHRLSNPSELLKIAADHYRSIHIIATGSSVLGASSRFRDTLAGRKTTIWLSPLTAADLTTFPKKSHVYRLERGGLPPFFLSEEFPESDFQEWMDAYWARDIQELFRLERRHAFQRLLELILADSGGMFEATRFARACEVSRQTITNYLAVLEVTYVAHVIRPFTTRRATEVVAAPRVYGFDTGFVAYYRGWRPLRREDYGVLWEHLVLNEILAARQTRDVKYWRDKQGHEIDFIISARGSAPLAIECKWSAKEFDPGNLRIFRRRYPRGDSLVVARDVERPYTRAIDGIVVTFLGLEDLGQRVGTPQAGS